MSLQRRDWLAWAAALSLGSLAPPASAQLLRRRRAEEPATEQPHDGADDTWVDTRRQREVPVRLRWPAGDGPAAMVLFSHGLGGSLEAGTRWAQAWVQAGLAVLTMQHHGSDSGILREGMAGARQAANGEQLIARTEDVRFVLDELTRRRQQGLGAFSRVRLDAIGLSGHSFGAHTTLAVAGQQYAERAGAGGMGLADPRPKAFAAFSPSPGQGSVATLKTRLAGITRPMLCLTGTLDGDPLGSERSGDHRREVFDALPAGHKAELWLNGADHMTFGGGQPQANPRALRRRAAETTQRDEAMAALIARVTTDWWRVQLLGDANAEAALRQPAGLGAGDAWRTG